MDKIAQTIMQIATGAQLVGGAILVICIILCGIKIMAGGAEGLRDGKRWFVGIVIGAILLFSASAIKEWLKQKATVSYYNKDTYIALFNHTLENESERFVKLIQRVSNI